MRGFLFGRVKISTWGGETSKISRGRKRGDYPKININMSAENFASSLPFLPFPPARF